MKRLSVITITFNNYDGLLKTLAVFQSGEFSNEIELVIVDGGSKDRTPEFLRQQHLTTNWVSEPDKGIYDAMNKGLQRSAGQYVWFLNAGDYAADRDALKTVLQALEGAPDAVYGETMLVNGNGDVMGTRSEQTTRKLPESLNWRSFTMGMNVGHQAFIIKKTLALPYDVSLKHVADIDWMIRCLKNCRTILNLHTIIACFTLEGHSTINRKASNRERFLVLGKHYGWTNNLWNHLRIILRHFRN